MCQFIAPFTLGSERITGNIILELYKIDIIEGLALSPPKRLKGAQRGFSGGKNPLSDVSAGAGLREYPIDPFDFAPARTPHRGFL